MHRHPPARRLALTAPRLLLLALLLLVAGVPSGHAAQPAADPPRRGIARPPARDRARLPKLDTALRAVAESAAASEREGLARAATQGLRTDGTRVQVHISIDAASDGAVRKLVGAVGGEVTGRADKGRLLQAWVPAGALQRLAADPIVQMLRRPGELVPLDALSTTEGLSVLKGDDWHAKGFAGAGVKVAVIDVGFTGYTALLGTDLPATVVAKNFRDGETDAQVDGSDTHGTACAEIIYDVAPAAQLYLVKIGSDVDLEEAVTWLKTQQVDIISMSLGVGEMTPGDGTGMYADLISGARAAGILWVNSAGNSREMHWGGSFQDTNADNWHEFDPSQSDSNVNWFYQSDGVGFSFPIGAQIIVQLRWDDWTAVNQDFDLHLYRKTETEWVHVASSENVQDGSPGQRPTERIDHTTTVEGVFAVAIWRHSATRNVNMDIFTSNSAFKRLDKVVYARSLTAPADVPAALTVAAVGVQSPFAQEYYSSQGPTNGPGGTATGGQLKPDIVAYAGVSTEGIPTFFGTSAAAPPVAGAAAVALSAYPTFTPVQLRSFLTGRAVDQGAAGPDTRYGYGRLSLGTPPTNKVKNRSFELDENGDGRPDVWTSIGKFTRSSALAFTGTYSSQHLANNDASYTVKQTVASLTAGKKYHVGCWVNMPATGDTFSFKLQVRWRNASNATISTQTVGSLGDDTAGAWVLKTKALVAPAGTTSAQLQMVVGSLNGAIYVDDCAFVG
jgi:subtilisin family serine protease